MESNPASLLAADDLEIYDVTDQASSSEDEDAASVSEAASLQMLITSGRVFVVEAIVHAAAGFRPSMQLAGRLLDIVPSGPGDALTLQPVPGTLDTRLSLRYEPPSPKFAHHKPGMASYRCRGYVKLLQLLQGSEFLFSKRGLPRLLLLDERCQACSWGALQLAFRQPQHMHHFLGVIRHVEVVKEPVWPTHVADLWCGGEGPQQLCIGAYKEGPKSAAHGRSKAQRAQRGTSAPSWAWPCGLAALAMAAGAGLLLMRRARFTGK